MKITLKDKKGVILHTNKKYCKEDIEVSVDAQEIRVTSTTEEQIKEGLFEKVTVSPIETETLDITPLETPQTKTGLYGTVNVEAIQTEEKSPILDFGELDKAETTPTEGKYIKKVTINKDANLIPENIKKGVNIFGVEGGFDAVDTRDADATSDDILLNKTAYVANTMIRGTFEPLDTSDATATAGDIVKDKTAYVNGEKIVGTLSLSAGSHNATIIGGAGFNARKCIKEVDLTGVSLSVTSTGAFQDCSNLETVKGLDLSTSTTLYNGFSACAKLKDLDINNTQNITNFYCCFKSNVAMQILKQLRGDKANTLTNCFQGCTNLTDFGGFLNLGKGYTGTTENNSSYKLDLSPCTKLTHESLMNVINGLYDLNLTYKVADGGTLKKQTLNLGSTNLAKLTADEIEIAINKGWNVT